MKKTETKENWYSRAKAEADKGIPRSERVFGVFIVLVSSLVMLYFITHQLESTGFFTSKFGFIETIMLYGNLTVWAITGALEGIFAKRLLSRLFDVFGGIIFITISIAWLLVIFPFNFVYFADVLPEFLRFLVQWISNDIAQGIMVIGIILMIVAAVYSPIAYKVVNLKHFRNQQNNS